MVGRSARHGAQATNETGGMEEEEEEVGRVEEAGAERQAEVSLGGGGRGKSET